MKRVHSFCLCCKAEPAQPRRYSLPRGLSLAHRLLLLGGSQARQPRPHRRGLPLPLRADLRFEALDLLHVPGHDLLRRVVHLRAPMAL